MKKNKIIILSIGLFFFICLSSIANFMPTEYLPQSLKLNAGEINIVTPENRTYIQPIEGYFLATYGFENDNQGDPPDDWVLNSMDGSSFVEVDSNLDGHNNVVEIRKNGGSSSAGMRNDFDFNVSIGAVEFWLYKDTDSGTDATFFSIVSIDGFLGNAQGVILDGDFYYMPSNFPSRILVASDIITINTWHQLRMEFNISKGWQISIDGTLYGQNYAFPFRGGVTGNPMASFQVQSLFSGGHPNYGAWVDAVGYSWDPQYSVGDNLNEGLLLSFENSTQLDWIGYSLDGQVNKTILGNIAFPMPSVGSHTVQVFGNNSLGTMYQSNTVFFTISNYSINIISPENKTYTGPTVGYYPATYGFENVEQGAFPEDWYGLNVVGSNYQIIDNFNGHGKVMEMSDQSSNWGLISTNFSSSVTISTIEFWYYPDTELYSTINLMSDISQDFLYIQFLQDVDIIRYYDGQYHSFYYNYVEKWYHIRIDVDYLNDNYDIYVDGNMYVEDGLFRNPADKCANITFQTWGSGPGSTGIVYIDAIGLSSDENYNIGDNLNEVLSFDGYYPATYGFENDVNGVIPNEFVDASGAGINIDVIEEFQSHRKVVKFDDQSTNNGVLKTNFTSNKTISTVEFWSYPDTSSYSTVDLWSDLTTVFPTRYFLSIQFLHDSNTIRVFDPDNYHTFYYNYVEKWYHIRFDIDYNKQEFDIYIDGVKFVDDDPFRNPAYQCGNITFGTWHSTTGVIYLDAVGLSTDANYEIGDNLNEGLLLGYETSKDLDWMGYSLDNKANITIMGNKDISMPSNGTHMIQVFGNDTFGAMYQSEKRYFTMDYNPINIITPENITYTEPMIGYYPATYGFEDDMDGAIPKSWVNYSGEGYSIKVIDEFNDHKKVVELKDQSPSEYPLMVNVFKTPQTVGTIELWVSTTDVTKGTYISFSDSSGNLAFYFEINNGELRFRYKNAYFGTSIANDQWFHLKVEFDCITDTVSSWLNEEKLITSGNFYNGMNVMEKIHINTEEPDSAYTSYFDAIGYSWDSYYNVGDNMDEGLLLSYENIANLKWVAYSLNDQIKHPLLGDKTLTIPEDGNHSIQVFGQDFLGNYYESELRYFSIDIAPFIKWQYLKDYQTVVLPPTESWSDTHAIFDFQYIDRKLDNVTLEINGTDFGTVWNSSSVVLSPFTDYTDGYVSAILYGYNNSILLVSDTLHFKFVKILNETTTILDSNTEVLGAQLYLILHDPHGDNSFSSFSEETTLSFGVGSEFTTAIGISVEISVDFSLFGFEIGASTNLEAKSTVGSGYDFRFEVKDTTSLTSSQVDDDADYIGPGYGDRYWGEVWLYKWVLNATLRNYSNGTTSSWEDPTLYYGILRDVEAFLSDEHAPLEWKNQNAVYNDTLPVAWIDFFTESGGAPYNFEHEVTTTTKRKSSFQVDLGVDFGLKFPGVETHVTIEMGMKNYVETGQEIKHKVAYQIYDDDPTDFIVQGIGIDERFGTYIFNTSSFFCETSNPLEHGTYDYLPPIIDFPSINLDPDNDGTGPTPSDSPIVTVDIFDEGGVQQVIMWYSTDGGLNWDSIYLPELITNPGTWGSSLPVQPVDTIVLWYIQAWDNKGNNSTRMDSLENPFEYTVVRKPEAPGGISSYPLFSTSIFLLGTAMAIIFFLRKKHFKYRR